MVRTAPAPRSVRQWCREPVYKLDLEPLRTPHCRHARKGRSTHSRLPPPGLRAGAADEEAMMEILYPRCAGLDIHRDSIVACVRLADSRIERHVESFGTTTTELERLSAWLSSYQVTHVAMEATGVYWKPVWAVLVEDFELLLANARHVKTVPGRKTDVNDAVWLADLLAHGLIRPSFVPPPAVQARRDLTRTRKQLTRERASHVQRIAKVLQGANLKLGSVLSNIMGHSGRAILDALAAGESTPETLAGLLRANVRASRAQVTEALHGRLAEHQRLLLRVHLGQIDAIEAAIAALDRELSGRLEPFREAVTRLSAMPGLSALSVAGILAEIGRGASDLLGRALSPQRRERGQAPLNPAAAGYALAQDPAGPGGLVRGQNQGQLLPGAVSATEGPPGSEEGHCGGGPGGPHRGGPPAPAAGGLPPPPAPPPPPPPPAP